MLRSIAIIVLLFTSLTALANQPSWRKVEQENLLYLQTNQGTVTIELAQFFAPRHVEYMRKLVQEGFYDGLPFYRVIENFVVQGGDTSGSKTSKVKTSMQAEIERDINKESPFTLVQSADLLAEQTGFIQGFAVGRSVSENKEWLIHCPGVINLARGNNIHSGTTDFAIMFGVSPRHLDRNMSVFGRVIDGWQALYKIERGDDLLSGAFSDAKQPSFIIKAYLGSQLAKNEQQHWLIEDTTSDYFQNKLAQRRKYSHDFYHHKGNGNLDVCYQKVASKQESK
ncbi:peptidylprolyl isomerase [Thalassotalea sp. HSM 43]|uniref:peptidylprolyl isomerase n=1 Tax=Thalassotalea sp. HSM 43 TaxID=2552945 RepID=UPI00108141B6|nr:peptidylprolyl isomerase [Thalassotalea sp. HSM 43]QBY05110.1 peptidylprolyl isomerase [Thalassotalea sp. HSM 43]